MGSPDADGESEQALIERAKTDPQAFGTLFDRHYPPIFGYVLRRVSRWNDAQDITAETFLKARGALWRYRWTGVPLSAWLYRIATNEIGIYFRRARRAPLSLDQLMEESGYEPANAEQLNAERRAAEAQLDREAEFAVVCSKITALPLRYQNVVALRFFEDKSVKEIAQILATREGTVKSLLSRGLRRLKKLL